eukprot:12747467-Heterocapsa_arctica.AAC.1
MPSCTVSRGPLLMDSALSCRAWTTYPAPKRVEQREGGVHIFPCESAKGGQPPNISRLAHGRLME